MKKRLLLSLMAMCMAVTGFALSNGEFVYTPQGRFQITGENLNANSAFNDFTGWTVVSASEDKTPAEQFAITGGAPGGGSFVQSLDPTAGEGMYFTFEPTSASASYVVSFKMKGVALDNTRTRINDGVDENVVKVFGDTDGTYADASNEVVCNTAEELTEDWQTFNYAIVGDGTARTYFISFTSMATTIEIADLQIAPAVQFADLRQRDAMLEKLNTYKNAYNWDAALLEDCGYNEMIASLEAIGDENDQEELNELLEIANEILTEFLNENMDDYLAGENRDSYFDFWRAKLQKQNTLGAWTVLPAGRGFWENADQGCADLGHYAGNTSWCGGSADAPMGVYMQKEMDPGAYVFSINSRAAVREKNTSSCWTDNEGWNVAYGVAYVVKVNEGADPDTIVSLVKDMDAILFTNFTITAKLEEKGTYEIGFKAYCKDAYKGLKNGSVTYLKNASLWGKNNNKYNQKQLGYEADVREQITTGRTQLTTAAENIANADYLWGKTELQACVDTVETKIAAYELLSQDDIIATYETDYVKSTSEETGYLVYTVYQEAVKDIIAANKSFVAVNDTLNSIQAIIDAAEATLGLRIYDAATGKEALKAAIAKAKDLQAQMKAAQYSEENAAAIVAANAALNEAIAIFKTTIPASAITTVVDIDFEQDAVLNEETQLYSIAGNAGSMEFSTFSLDGTGNQPFEKGYWANGEQMYAGYIRVGNGTGTVNFDPTEAGSMGTNILKVNFDFFLQGLSGKSLGFSMKDETAENTVAIFYANYYNSTIGANDNTFGISQGNLQYDSGASYNNVAPEGAVESGTVLPKNSFELIFDFGEGSMYATTTSKKGVVTTEKIVFDGTVPHSFILQCNYNNNDRRCWFDNLKIERISAGATDKFVPSGIEEVNTADTKVVAPTKVFKNGRIVINGKYGINGMLIK